MLVALVALVVALEGPAIANESAHVARLISGSKIKRGTITGKQIRNHTIKAIDLHASVLGGLVGKVPGTVNEAPNAAALGGKDASSFYDKTDSDLRFVAKVPGTSNEASNSAALEGHPASDFAIRGADVTGTIHGDAGAVPAQSCTTSSVDAAGTEIGDVPVMAFVGNTPAPPGLTFQLLKVSSPGSVTMRFCNPTNVASPAFADVGVRIIAFR
jgi:hypothetical protein